eukprot:2405203-Pyramimonas_sp.AAC.1
MHASGRNLQEVPRPRAPSQGRGAGKGKGKEYQQMTKQLRSSIARIAPITRAESSSMPWAAVYEEPPNYRADSSQR